MTEVMSLNILLYLNTITYISHRRRNTAYLREAHKGFLDERKRGNN